MLIDWFTVGAQALNFIILVWLLKRFLYKPILNAIDNRERRIAAELSDANAKRTEAQKERDEFHRKSEAFDQGRAALLSKATDEAKVECKRLLDDARKEADLLTAKRQEALRIDAETLNQSIRRRTQQEVFDIARKALMDLAATSLEERMGEVFMRRLHTLEAGAKEGLANALRKSSEPAVIRSAFDLSVAQHAAIQNSLNEVFSADVKVHFETTPDVISGIELSADGQKVSWSIADYLSALDKGVDDLLKEKGNSRPKASLQPGANAEAKLETAKILSPGQ